MQLLIESIDHLLIFRFYLKILIIFIDDLHSQETLKLIIAGYMVSSPLNIIAKITAYSFPCACLIGLGAHPDFDTTRRKIRKTPVHEEPGLSVRGGGLEPPPSKCED